jgi:LemA protein
MTHESDTFAKIAELRTSWANASSVSEKAKIDNEISSTLKTIMAVSESYPELKADTSFLKLSDELRSTEDKISYSRQFYNDTVTRYNSKTELFPSNIIAGMFNFRKADLFMAESDEARKNVKVDFNK